MSFDSTVRQQTLFSPHDIDALNEAYLRISKEISDLIITDDIVNKKIAIFIFALGTSLLEKGENLSTSSICDETMDLAFDRFL